MASILDWYKYKCKEADFHRLGVMAFVLLVQTCILIPITLLVVTANGSNLLELGLITIFSFAVLVSAIGHIPFKTTFPLFILSILVHIYIVVMNLI